MYNNNANNPGGPGGAGGPGGGAPGGFGGGPPRKFGPPDRGNPNNRPRPNGPRINDRIRVPEVRVIGAAGEMLGVMRTDEARRLAIGHELDLVEVNPKAMPPVCKVMDYGKFKYEEKKKANDTKKRQVKVELKEIKLRPKTDDHDLDFKTKNIRRFLEEGNKVKITVRFRGREITHPETAVRQIEHILREVQDICVIEQPNRMEGKAMTALIGPKMKTQSVRRPEGGPPGAGPGPSGPGGGVGGPPRAAAPGGPARPAQPVVSTKPSVAAKTDVIPPAPRVPTNTGS